MTAARCPCTDIPENTPPSKEIDCGFDSVDKIMRNNSNCSHFVQRVLSVCDIFYSLILLALTQASYHGFIQFRADSSRLLLGWRDVRIILYRFFSSSSVFCM